MLTVVPCTREEAKAFVTVHHRHHKPSVGDVFCLAVADEAGEVRGVVQVGRPVARKIDDGWTLEVTRCCTDGTRNAASMLYGAAWRAARALGWRRLLTYTLETESGASLRGAGWRLLGQATSRPGQGWNVATRPRVDTHPLQGKLRWEAPA